VHLTLLVGQGILNLFDFPLLLCAFPVPLVGPETHDEFGVNKNQRRNHDNRKCSAETCYR
jgi:hypothetical protein